MLEEAGGVVLRFGPHQLRLDDPTPELGAYLGRRIALGIRPEDVEDAAVATGAPPGHRITVTVDIKEDMGSEVFLHFAVDAPTVKSDELAEVVGAEALEAADAQTHHHGTTFIARVDRTNRAREGERVELVVDTRHLHFFDLETGMSISETPRPAEVSVVAAST